MIWFNDGELVAIKKTGYATVICTPIAGLSFRPIQFQEGDILFVVHGNVKVFYSSGVPDTFATVICRRGLMHVGVLDLRRLCE